MPEFKKFTVTDKSPYDQINRLEREIRELRSKIESERFTGKDRMIRNLIISKTGRFKIEEKDSLPTTSEAGEMTFANDRFYGCTTANTWYPLSLPRVRSIAAGTASDSPTRADGLIQASTNGAQALTITLPEAADNIGLLLIITFVTDGGQNITVNRTGADTIDDNGDTGNTAITLADAGDTIILQAVQNNIWAVINNIGCTLT